MVIRGRTARRGRWSSPPVEGSAVIQNRSCQLTYLDFPGLSKSRQKRVPLVYHHLPLHSVFDMKLRRDICPCRLVEVAWYTINKEFKSPQTISTVLIPPPPRVFR